MDEQPTYNELRRALNDLAILADIPGSRTEALINLAMLRRKKTTWIGKEENELRYSINEALAYHGVKPYGYFMVGDVYAQLSDGKFISVPGMVVMDQDMADEMNNNLDKYRRVDDIEEHYEPSNNVCQESV